MPWRALEIDFGLPFGSLDPNYKPDPNRQRKRLKLNPDGSLGSVALPPKDGGGVCPRNRSTEPSQTPRNGVHLHTPLERPPKP